MTKHQDPYSPKHHQEPTIKEIQMNAQMLKDHLKRQITTNLITLLELEDPAKWDLVTDDDFDYAVEDFLSNTIDHHTLITYLITHSTTADLE